MGEREKPEKSLNLRPFMCQPYFILSIASSTFLSNILSEVDIKLECTANDG